MRLLFFIVHPSKYHLFKHTIRRLKNEGHQVDLVIVTKDVLEELIINEGWEYTNIIPEGRRSKKLPKKLSTIYFAAKTLFKLWNYTRGKKYDLFITDDLLVLIGKIRKVKSYFFVDDDISIVPELRILFKNAVKIVAPICTNINEFENKKIGFNSYKELAYLTPEIFQPDIDIINQYFDFKSKFFLIRLVDLTATHDINNNVGGLSKSNVEKLINYLSKFGEIVISSEKPLLPEFENYRLKIHPKDIHHFLYYSDLLITDSQTMTSEAAVLGTPSVRINDFVGKISVMEEKENIYGLSYGFKPSEFYLAFQKIKEIIENNEMDEWNLKRKKLLDEKVDMNEFLYEKIINKYEN